MDNSVKSVSVLTKLKGRQRESEELKETEMKKDSSECILSVTLMCADHRGRERED